ncbi:MAG: hypothetical protein GY800_01165 [Planctomycetes bacterium]|nr:hypothetical protein [Planctomycetota bacterium]
MEPTIIDIFTSPAESTQRKKLFGVGESIQWNIVHTISPDSQSGAPFKAFWILRRHKKAGFLSDDIAFDTIFTPSVVRYHDSAYNPSGMNRTRWTYDSIFEPTVEFDNLTREQSINKILYDRSVSVFIPGVWEFTAVVELTGSEVTDEGRFDVLGGWHYRIGSSD